MRLGVCGAPTNSIYAKHRESNATSKPLRNSLQIRSVQNINQCISKSRKMLTNQLDQLDERIAAQVGPHVPDSDALYSRVFILF